MRLLLVFLVVSDQLVQPNARISISTYARRGWYSPLHAAHSVDKTARCPFQPQGAADRNAILPQLREAHETGLAAVNGNHAAEQPELNALAEVCEGRDVLERAVVDGATRPDVLRPRKHNKGGENSQKHHQMEARRRHIAIDACVPLFAPRSFDGTVGCCACRGVLVVFYWQTQLSSRFIVHLDELSPGLGEGGHWWYDWHCVALFVCLEDKLLVVDIDELGRRGLIFSELVAMAQV
jgi:hypothetical protein